MVHGYDNTIAEAEKSYSKMAANLPGSVIGFHWPANQLYFYSKFFAARHGSQSFCRLLSQDFGLELLKQTVIVAHSMGCRLVLDALTRMFDADGPPLRPAHLHLMGPAVDNEDISKGEKYFNGTLLPKKTSVYWSRDDDVLKFAYMAADTNVALGYTGPDGSVHHTVEDHKTTLGHSDYWGSSWMFREVKRSLLRLTK